MAKWLDGYGNPIKTEKMFFVLDSRAKTLWLEHGADLRKECGDPGRYMFEAGTLKECCKACNAGDYGDDCIVTDDDYVVQEKNWNGTHWTTKIKKEDEKSNDN